METHQRNKTCHLIIQNFFLSFVQRESIKSPISNQPSASVNKKKIQLELFLVKCFLRLWFILWKTHFMDIKVTKIKNTQNFRMMMLFNILQKVTEKSVEIL